MTEPTAAPPYRVLARKYRPSTFAELIGQEAMVRTLTNAIHSGRLAHSFMLTGVRGVGKTTTARIVARALNCASGPTPEPCGACEHCRAIAEDRHVDVLEMDAASRTGVGDIRELIDGVRYRPTSARYKIYIIDEVHMLSNNAFNALLKTLEEPPEHVKFIFATTEIRKVPVTVLSRCQRFDLRRVDAQVLSAHFTRIATAEGAAVEAGAAALLARAADGSVRDGLSLLDQAISHGGTQVSERQVADMLGLADRGMVFDLFDFAMKGDIKAALDLMAEQYTAGADPLVVLQDLLELTHWLTRVKLVPDAGAQTASELERERGGDMARRLSMPVLTRAWQMLLKGLSEARLAPSPLQAAEMVLVRLAYVADAPTPGDLVARLRDAAPGSAASPRPAPAGGGGDRPRASLTSVSGGASAALAVKPAPAPAPGLPDPQSFEQVVALVAERREGLLQSDLINKVRLVKFEPGRIEFNPDASAPRDLANRLGKLLTEWTGRRWVVTVSGDAGQSTLRETQEIAVATRRDEAAAHPFVRAILETFPGATIETVRDPAPLAAEADGLEAVDSDFLDTEFTDGDDFL